MERVRAKTGRFAEWADRYLVPATITCLLVTDVLIGLNWIISPPGDLRSPAYDVGEALLPLHAWGTLFLVLATVASTLYLIRGRCWGSGYVVGGLLSGLWGFWTVMFFIAPMGRAGGSYSLAALSLGMCLLHCLIGLASAHRSGTVVARSWS